MFQPVTFSMRRKPRLAPMVVDLRRFRPAVAVDALQHLAHIVGQSAAASPRPGSCRCASAIEASAWARISAGIGEQAAPVAGVVSALAQIDAEREVAAAAVAKRDVGLADLRARAVGGEEGVGGEVGLVGLDDLLQALGAVLLAHLEEELVVEAEGAARGENDACRAAMWTSCWPLLSAVPRP